MSFCRHRKKYNRFQIMISSKRFVRESSLAKQICREFCVLTFWMKGYLRRQFLSSKLRLTPLINGIFYLFCTVYYVAKRHFVSKLHISDKLKIHYKFKHSNLSKVHVPFICLFKSNWFSKVGCFCWEHLTTFWMEAFLIFWSELVKLKYDDIYLQIELLFVWPFNIWF